MIKQMVLLSQEEFLELIMPKLFELQAMVNRYHSNKYERDILKEKEKLQLLLPKYQ